MEEDDEKNNNIGKEEENNIMENKMEDHDLEKNKNDYVFIYNWDNDK